MDELVSYQGKKKKFKSIFLFFSNIFPYLCYHEPPKFRPFAESGIYTLDAYRIIQACPFPSCLNVT